MMLVVIMINNYHGNDDGNDYDLGLWNGCNIIVHCDSKSNDEEMISQGVANGKIRDLPRRRDPCLKIRARDSSDFWTKQEKKQASETR